MSREPKKMNESIQGSSKLIVYIAVAVVIAIVIVSYVVIANIIGANKEKQRLAEIENREKQIAEQESIASKTQNSNEDSESVSTQIGKTVEESNKENQTSNDKSASANKNTTDEKSTSSNKNTTDEKASSANKATQKDNEGSATTSNETKKEITFCMPVEGEIVRGFAKESLVYSETLQEWIVHQAIDIKANSRDVVKAAAEGTVKAIKSDPRYGLTVIIEHDGGFKTVYSNLLTAEFVVEGEQVKQGQTLGTVGSSATFEIADEPHLHFEMLKDSVYVDPTLYIK